MSCSSGTGSRSARSKGAADDALRLMKHLRVLEQAGLVTTKRRGRESRTS